MSTKHNDEDLLSTAELAAELNLSTAQLVNLRIKGGGPPFEKYGKALNATVRYKWGDVQEWRNANKFANTKEYLTARMSA